MTGDVARLIGPPALAVVGFLVARGWPGASATIARVLAALLGLALVGVLATGCWHVGPGAAAHRWGSHGLFLLAWNAVPFSIGILIARSRPRRLARVLASIAMLGAFFLASVTGYLGPSQGPIDPMTSNRFRVLHYGAFAVLAVALYGAWVRGLSTSPPPEERGPTPCPAEPSSATTDPA